MGRDPMQEIAYQGRTHTEQKQMLITLASFKNKLISSLHLGEWTLLDNERCVDIMVVRFEVNHLLTFFSDDVAGNGAANTAG